MQDKPYISIITASFNSGKTIEQTIKSVLCQQMRDYEYIIVDGGSTDNTIGIIEQYLPLFEGRMSYSSEPDKGIYNAFNKGCKKAKGKYIWIVNSDDYIESNALLLIKQIWSKKTGEADPIIMGKINFVDNKGVVIKEFPANAQLSKTAYERNQMINHPATIVPCWVYEKYGLYDEQFRIAADKDWFHRIYPQNIPFLYLDDSLTNMRKGGASGHLTYRKMVKEQVRFFKNKYGVSFRFIGHMLLWHVRYIKALL